MSKHALTHDVAYNSLLVQRRRHLHPQIACAVEELYGDRLAEQYEILAHHSSRAEDWPKALEYLLKAGEKAAQGFANREAVALYDQALEAVGHLGDDVSPTTRMTIHRAKVNLYAVLSDFARARAEGERFLALAREIGDRVAEAEAQAALGMWSLWAHDFEPALGHAREAMAIAEPIGAQAALAEAHLVTGWVHTVCERLDKGRAHAVQAVTISEAAQNPFFESISRLLLAQYETWEGGLDARPEYQAAGLRIAREHNLVLPLLYGHFVTGLARTTRGDYQAGHDLFREGLALSERVGDEVWLLRFLNCQGWVHIELGDLETALDLNRRGAEGAKKR